jgi:hypothetical protein
MSTMHFHEYIGSLWHLSRAELLPAEASKASLVDVTWIDVFTYVIRNASMEATPPCGRLTVPPVPDSRREGLKT